MKNQDFKEILQDSAYLIKQYILLCNEVERATPLRVYERLIRALNNLEPTEEQKENQKLLSNQTNINNHLEHKRNNNNASAILVSQGVLLDKQVRHKNNLRFINECDDFIIKYGQERFIKVVKQVKMHQENGGIKNIYGYIKNSLSNEIKEGAKYEKRS